MNEDLYSDCYSNGYAFFDYVLDLPSGESTIVVTQPLKLGTNSLYKPTIYVGQILSPAQMDSLSFSATTDQFLIDCTVPLNNNSYSGKAVESFKLAFCAEKTPNPVADNVKRVYPPWLIAVEIILCVFIIASLIFLVVSFIINKKSYNEKNK